MRLADVSITESEGGRRRRHRPRGQRIRRALGLVSFVAIACTTPAYAADRGDVRPYDAASPWNMPIPPNAVVGAAPIPALVNAGLRLTADPDQYTPPVYIFDDTTPRHSIRMSNYFSTYDNGDGARVGHGFAPTVGGVPVPAAAAASAGNDAHIVIWDPRAGVEYGFWQFDRDGAGNYNATNGYRYHTTAGYNGRFADGKAGRGAGTTYLAGVVRPWEIARGRIDHALAFVFNSPSRLFVFPASKSDGTAGPNGLPAGSRLQLDPALDSSDFDEWELAPAARVIARALQEYGMYVVGVSGSSKILLEDRRTARWSSAITRNLTRSIPMSAFRLVTGTEDASQRRPERPPARARPAVDAQADEARRIMQQLRTALRRARPRALRARRGLRIVLRTRSRSSMQVTVTTPDRERRRLLTRGALSVATPGRTAIRLRPTSAHGRLLRARRWVAVQLRLRVPGARRATSLKRMIRLRT